MNGILRTSCLLRIKRPYSLTSVRSIVRELTEQETPSLGSPSETNLNRIEFPPFIKDIFIGTFNKSILSYAEVLNYERYFVLNEQVRQLAAFLGENKETLSCINQRGSIPDEILMKMKGLDLHGLMVPAEYGGAELMNTEVLRLFQELGVNLSLSELFNINEMICTKAIVNHGSQDQKTKYLPKISSGEWWTGFCFTEKGAGSDPNSVQAKVKFDDSLDMYRLTGTKTWVSNAIRSNLFLVFANLNAKNYLGEEEESLTAFLVEKDIPGVEVSIPNQIAGFNGLQVCDVNFNCLIPKSAILGEPGAGLEILKKINHENKYFMTAGIITRLKSLLKDTVHHALARKQFGNKLSEFELIRIQIAKCTTKIYALESMLYITSGLADVGKEPDIEVESAIVKQFAVETFDYVTRHCLSILGAQTNLKDSKYQEFIAENQVLQSWQGSNNIIKCFIAISGILHLINNKGEYLKQCNRPGVHPIKSFKYKVRAARHKVDYSPKTFMLEHYVHPRMARAAPQVEWAAHKLAICAENVLLDEGLNIQLRESKLERISDIAMETYAMVCVLSRASRSYVVGHAHAQHEVSLAIPFIFESRQRVEEKVKQILYQTEMQGERDLFYEDAGAYVLEHGGYCAVNPLVKNSV